MDALTLSRKVADIDGWSGVDTITNVGALSAVVDGKGGVMGKALLFDLMYKHDVSVCRYRDSVFIESDYTDGPHKADVSFSDEKEFYRAILECIIQANEQ